MTNPDRDIILRYSMKDGGWGGVGFDGRPKPRRSIPKADIAELKRVREELSKDRDLAKNALTAVGKDKVDMITTKYKKALRVLIRAGEGHTLIPAVSSMFLSDGAALHIVDGKVVPASWESMNDWALYVSKRFETLYKTNWQVVAKEAEPVIYVPIGGMQVGDLHYNTINKILVRLRTEKLLGYIRTTNGSPYDKYATDIKDITQREGKVVTDNQIANIIKRRDLKPIIKKWGGDAV